MMQATQIFMAVGSWALLATATLVIATTGPQSAVDSQSVPRTGKEAPQVTNVDLRHIVDARLPPYAAVGKFKGTMGCTAAIVLHPRIIVTAAHCVTQRDGSIKQSNLSFRLGYQAETALGDFQATVWTIGSIQSFRRQSVHDASQDWAILVLDRAAVGVHPFLLSFYSVASLKSLEQQIRMPSYSNDIGDAEVLSVDPACTVRDLVWDALIHDCKARYGSSGAPLLVRDGPWYAMVGIHTGSMFASDEDGHVAKFIGNRAIAASMFADAVVALSRRLDAEPYLTSARLHTDRPYEAETPPIRK
ncbi:trypsin-like serine peptidase [Bradyrhizobium murdochi]|uniref:trypsin-like serine peptidase n=1 Tax=Bradyrhizobium murdochi TaxID=1038859 RepID=UPI00048D81A2|nr:trypsin-like serine protease [Bradyrhizobium murdochi]